MFDMKKMFTLLSAMMFLISAHVASFGSICIDNDGFHVDISSQHGCCESESVSNCETDGDCFDLALHLDVSREAQPNKGPGVSLSYITISLIAYDNLLAQQSGLMTASAELPSASSPLATVRITQLLV